MATHYNAKFSCNMDKERTSAFTPPRCATLLDISIGLVNFRLRKCPPLLTISTTNGLHRCILRSGMPDDATVSRRTLLRRRNICRSANGSATIAEESVDDCHYSDPQQALQRPFLCFGLHLFCSSPQILASSGAMWSVPTETLAVRACSYNFIRTHWLKLGILEAIIAVVSSIVMVFV